MSDTVAATRLSWQELLRRTVAEAIDDDCMGMAAQLSYYFCLSLFPALLVLLALSSFFSLNLLTDDVAATLGNFVSPEILTLIQDQMRRLADADDSGILTIGVIGALWGSSSALVAIVSSVNRAYDLPETRPWWRVRLIALALTVSLAFLILSAAGLIVAGPHLAAWMGLPVTAPWDWGWVLVRGVLSFGLVAFAIGLVYNYAPDADQEWLWVTPGAVVATGLWLVSSLAFNYYIAHFTDYQASYGAVGGILILLLWLYVSSLGILAGAELNSEIEHASLHDRAALTNATGRRVIGARAARLFERRTPPRALADPSHSVDGGQSTPLLGALFTTLVIARRLPRRLSSRS